MMIVHPRETLPHTRSARAQPPAAHRRRHSRPHHRRHGEHSPTARQLHSNGLCSPPKEGPSPGSVLRHVDAGPSTKGADARIVQNAVDVLPRPPPKTDRSELTTRNSSAASRLCDVHKGGLASNPFLVSIATTGLTHLSPAIYSRTVPSSFPNPVAELACATRPWSALQEARPRDGGLLCESASSTHFFSRVNPNP